MLGGVRDSKQLSEMQREEMFERVAAKCLSWSIGAASALWQHACGCAKPDCGLLAAVTREAAEELLRDEMWFKVGEFSSSPASVHLC